ncbi:hypothetical protein TNCV_2599661 [Trichonephila clavipes]|nr:hypothetical protein TNCV_2599661 [Trichonephila clavipes]
MHILAVISINLNSSFCDLIGDLKRKSTHVIRNEMVMGGRQSPRYNCSFYICPVYRKQALRNLGRQDGVLAWTVESNQGARIDGNESVADSFRSGAVSYKRTDARFLVAFPP